MQRARRGLHGLISLLVPCTSVADEQRVVPALPSAQPAWTLSLPAAIGLVVGMRVLFGLAAALAYYTSAKNAPMFAVAHLAQLPEIPSFARPELLPWLQWDTAWYLAISVHGYSHVPWSTAFQPLYPLVIHVVTPVCCGVPLVAALLVSSVAFGAACYLFSRLVALHWDGPIARRSLVVLLCSPCSFFFLAAYSESLFLVSSIAAVYLAERHRYGMSGVAAAFAYLSRSQGLALLPALAVYAWQVHGSRQRAYAALRLLVPVALTAVIYQVVVTKVLGLPSATDAMQRQWNVRIQPPWETIWQYMRVIRSPRFSLFGAPAYNFGSVINLATALLSLALLVWGTKRVPLTWTVYGCASWVIALSRFESTSRYITVIFPLYVVLALLSLRAPKRIQVLGVALSLALLGFLSTAQLVGNFVA